MRRERQREEGRGFMKGCRAGEVVAGPAPAPALQHQHAMQCDAPGEQVMCGLMIVGDGHVMAVRHASPSSSASSSTATGPAGFSFSFRS